MVRTQRLIDMIRSKIVSIKHHISQNKLSRFPSLKGCNIADTLELVIELYQM